LLDQLAQACDAGGVAQVLDDDKSGDGLYGGLGTSLLGSVILSGQVLAPPPGKEKCVWLPLSSLFITPTDPARSLPLPNPLLSSAYASSTPRPHPPPRCLAISRSLSLSPRMCLAVVLSPLGCVSESIIKVTQVWGAGHHNCWCR